MRLCRVSGPVFAAPTIFMTLIWRTKLRIHPFAVMDGTLKDYMKLSPADAIDQIRQLVDEVKTVNGTFISLWHNESLSNQQRWTGWLRVYEELLEMATEQ